VDLLKEFRKSRNVKMGQGKRRFLSGSGFTLIELLVVISIIMMLIGLLATGIQGVKRHATNLRQKSNFHAIEVGLELFQKDYDDYPPSEMIDEKSDGSPGPKVCGAQHLAEALVGRDTRGFDPKTNWYAPDENESIYANVTAKGSTQQDEAASRTRRWKLFIELKEMGAFVMHDLYENYNGDVYSTKDPCSPDSFRAPVLTDIFRQKEIKVPYKDHAEWVGSPILYYKANSSSRLFKKVPGKNAPAQSDDFTNWIYNYEDNRGIIELGTIKDPAVKHHFDEEYTYTEDGRNRNGVHLFYKTITNPKVSYDKPFNAATFILISAGRDGIYGTRDDITNFDY